MASYFVTTIHAWFFNIVKGETKIQERPIVVQGHHTKPIVE